MDCPDPNYHLFDYLDSCPGHSPLVHRYLYLSAKETLSPPCRGQPLQYSQCPWYYPGCSLPQRPLSEKRLEFDQSPGVSLDQPLRYSQYPWHFPDCSLPQRPSPEKYLDFDRFPGASLGLPTGYCPHGILKGISQLLLVPFAQFLPG